LKSLVRGGWFELVKASEINAATGRNTATHYRVLSHEEWTAKHPDSCFDYSESWQETLSQLEGTDKSPSQSEGRPSQSQGMDRPNLRECPSQLEGTNLYKTPIDLTHTSTNTPPSPYPLIGTVISVPSNLDGATETPVPVKEGGPYPQIGTVDPAVASILATLGTHSEHAAVAWRKVVTNLTGGERSPHLIADVVNFYVREYGVRHVRAEGANNFAVSFQWLLQEMTEKQNAERSAA
jgi:hypothetical protein